MKLPTSETSHHQAAGSSGCERMRISKGLLPNMRVQRTRSSPSALRSPLTRHPLGVA
jgi:hypothetical protein